MPTETEGARRRSDAEGERALLAGSVFANVLLVVALSIAWAHVSCWPGLSGSALSGLLRGGSALNSATGYETPLGWEARFLGDGAERPATEAERFYADRPPLSDGSSALFNSSGVNWAILNNVCWEAGNRIVMLQARGGAAVFPENWETLYPEQYSAFGLGAWEWSVRETDDAEAFMTADESVFVPREASYDGLFRGDGTWITTSMTQPTMLQVMETYLGFFHVRMHQRDFPPLVTALGNADGFVSKESAAGEVWEFVQSTLLEHASSSAAPLPPLRVLQWGRDSQAPTPLPAHKTRVCFERVYVMGRMSILGGGGLFASLDDARVFQRAVRAHWRPLLLPPPQRTLRMLIVRHSPEAGQQRDGFIADTRAVERIANRLGINIRFLDHDNLGRLDAVNVSTAIQWTANADILIGAHGSALANMLWMARGSAVVEIMPYRYQQTTFHALAASAGLEYDFLPDRSAALPPSASAVCDYEKYTDWAVANRGGNARCAELNHPKGVHVDEDALEARLRKLSLRIVVSKYGGDSQHAVALTAARYGQSLVAKKRMWERSCCDNPPPSTVGPDT